MEPMVSAGQDSKVRLGRAAVARRLVPALAAVLAVGCAAREPTPPRPPPPAAKAAFPKKGSSWFYSYRHDAYWAQRVDGRDHLVLGGARVVAEPSARLVSAAWEHSTVLTDALTGSHAVLPSLGGGFVHFSAQGERASVFLSREFTGPLEPLVALDLPLRGARNGTSSVLLLGEWGPTGLDVRSKRLVDVGFPAVGDFAALDENTAVRLDLFARAHVTRDGGKTWQDVHKELGLPVRGLTQTPSELLLDTAVGRGRLGKDGRLIPPADGYFRGYADYQRPYQIQLPGMGNDGSDLYWGHYSFRESPAAALAVESGVALGDGRIVGARRGAVFLLDQGSGELLELHTDWANGTNDCDLVSVQGLPADPKATPREVLYLCGYDDGVSFGRCVLRAEGASPPALEKCFGAGGGFVHTDEGGVGFQGSCDEGEAATHDYGRWEPEATGPNDQLCVRRGQGDWVQRKIEVGDDEVVAGWVPAASGQVVALVTPAGHALPAVVAQRRPSVRPHSFAEGVRVIRPAFEPGWSATAQANGMSYDGWGTMLDRRFGLAPDGSVWAWLSASDGEARHGRWSSHSYEVRAPVRISRDGVVTELGAPADTRFVASGGRFGVALLESGDLLETTDHGESWQPAGLFPVSPEASSSRGNANSCGELGCSLGLVSRLGWGASELAVRATRDPSERRIVAPPWTPPRPRLVCKASGSPLPIVQRRESSTTNVSTGWGDTFTLVHETDDPAAIKPDQPLLSTGTFVYWPPFGLDREPRRINGTNLPKSPGRAPAMALVDQTGKVSLLVQGEAADALVEGAEVFGYRGERRWGGSGASVTGLRTGKERALTVSERNGRTGVEVRGPAPVPPSFALGGGRQLLSRRPLTLGIGKDGTPAVLVIDPSPTRPAALALLSGAGAALDRVTLAAGFADARAGDDAACSNVEGYRAIVPLLGSGWLEVGGDFRLQLGARQNGLALVRWSEKLVCVDAVQVSGMSGGERLTLVARFDGKKGKSGAVVRSNSMAVPATCTWERAPRGGP